MPVQKDGVEGRADEAGKDADRHLSYTQRPGRGVHEQQEDAAHKARGGNEFGVIRPYTHSREVRDDQTDPADGAGNADRTRGHQRGTGNGDVPNDLDIGAEALCLRLTHGEDVQPPAHREQDDGGNDHGRKHAADLRQRHIRETAHSPVRNGRQFRLRVCHILDEAQDGTHGAADDDTGQDEHDVRVALHGRRNEDRESNGNNSAYKRETGQQEAGESQQDGDGGANAGTTGNTQEVRRDERVLEDALVRDTGHGEHDAYQDGRRNAREPEAHDNVAGHLRILAAPVEQLSKEDVDAFLRGDRVLSCTERNDH